MEDEKLIYESPDGGKTVYARRMHSLQRWKVDLTPADKVITELTNNLNSTKEDVQPNFDLIAKHTKLKQAFKKYLKIQKKYASWEEIVNEHDRK